MSSTRYLEFDSTYRDRKLYPEANNFIIEMSQSGQGTKLRARDPVSDSSPVLIWNSSFREDIPSISVTSIQVSPVNIGTAGTTTFQIVTDPVLKQVRNYYVGAVLCNESTPVAPYTVRRITEYLPINLSNAIISVDSSIPDSLIGTNTFAIFNPSCTSTDSVNTLIKFYIPGSNNCRSQNQRLETFGLGGDNYYINYYITNTTTGTSRKIVAFDAFTRLATLDSPTPIGENWVSGASFNFCIRKNIPYEGGLSSTIISATTTSVQLSNTATTTMTTGFLDGDFLRIAANTVITPYSGATCEERQIQRYIYGNGVFASVVGVNVNLGLSGSSGSEYIGCFITDSIGNTAVILSYNGQTKDAIVSAAVLVAGTWFIRTCFLTSPFSAAPLTGDLFEIEMFTRDNSNPFNYTGSLVSSEELVCYDVELINLILPNFLLESSRGGRAIFYPYLYVELQQVSSSCTTNRNIIYSNNPHSYRMLFRAVVDDTPVPVISPFIKIDGNGMSHTIKFKPNDSFRFAVYHSNGEPFKTIFSEQYSPTAPNPLCQISACFSFRRV